MQCEAFVVLLCLTLFFLFSELDLFDNYSRKAILLIVEFLLKLLLIVLEVDVFLSFRILRWIAFDSQLNEC